MTSGYRQRIHPMSINIMPSTLESCGTVATIPASELDVATASNYYRNVDLKKQKRQDSIRNLQSLEEIRWSSMRKKIPGMSSVPKHISTNPENYSDLHSKYMKDLRQFIRQHFHMRECSRFIPAPKQKVKFIKQLKCHCGAVFTDHAGIMSKPGVANQMIEQYVVPSELQRFINKKRLDDPVPTRMPEVKWTPDNIRKTVTNAFGKINFVNVEHVGGNKPAKYIRMSMDDSVEDLFELMTKYWRVMDPKSPNLVISVVGGAKNFKLDGRMRTTFSAGLIKAAKTTSAWLIASGFNMGVMKAVGQAVNEGQSFCWDNNRMAHVLRCIGIAPWGYVRGRKALIETEDGLGQFCAEYRTSNVILHGEPVPLNSDHTHFIFVDDGYRNRYGGVAAVRAKIEQKISQPVADGGLGIPVVLVVVEGGTDAIADAKSSLEHRIPVVVCAGTGRAADILAYAYSHTKSMSGGTREMSEKHMSKLKEKIYDAYGKTWKDEEIDDKTNVIKDSVQICCQNADLMIIFNMNKAEDLDMAILSVLLKAQAGGDEIQRLTQLKLALTWNRVDIAQEEIFREDVLWRQGSLDEVLTEAIVTDKVKFMELILQQGVIMKEYLTLDRLEQLYLQVPRHHHIYKLMVKLTGATELNRQNVLQLLSRLLDRYDTDDQLDFDPDMFVEENEELDTRKLMFARPYKHLLIYAVLLHRQSLAKFCWEMGDEPVTTAVAVTRLYSAMIRQITRDESILRDTITEYKKEFETLAVKVLDECQQKDPGKAMMIVERNSPVWNEMTCLQIAAASNDQVFLSSEACMDSISTTWKQGITSGWNRILFATFFPPLIPFIVEILHFGSGNLTFFQKIASFYTAPAVKFVHNTLLYLVFVVLHSYMVLVEFRPDKVTPTEILCVFWVFTFMVDYIHTFVEIPAPTLMSKFRDFYGVMHYLDWCTVITYIIAFILHLYDSDYSSVTKVLYCVNTVIFFMGITKAYTAFENLGPKLVMIKGMFGELRLFIMVLLIFLLAYGVAHQGLLYHERAPSWKVLRDVFYYPYWQLYGEIYLEEIESDSGMCVEKSADCRTSHWLVPIILAAYLMVGNILLLNLLIAIFSNVFQQVEKNSQEIWKFQMYFLVMEYDKKTFLVPPLSIIPQTLYAVAWLFRKTCCKRDITKQKLGKRHLEYLQLFEKEMMTNYLRRAKANELENLEMTVQKLEKRVDELTKIIEDEVIGDQQTDPFSFLMTNDGQPYLFKKSDTVSEFLVSNKTPWPIIPDVLSVKDQVAQSDIPAEYLARPMLRSGSGLFVLPAKTQSDNLVKNSGSSIVQTSTELETVKSEVSKTENEGNDKMSKQSENSLQDTKDVMAENATVEDKSESLVAADDGTGMLSEKERKKIEKAKRKEEKRKRKEEKRAKREKSKEREQKENINGFKHSSEIHGEVLNNVNQPLSTEDAGKIKVKFNLGDTLVKEGEGALGPQTDPIFVRPPEIISQTDNLDKQNRAKEERQWNIEDVIGSEEEVTYRERPSRRFSRQLNGDTSSDDGMSL